MITITVQDCEVLASLQAITQRIGNMGPVLQAIGDDITERTKRRFDTSTGPDGMPWKANSPDLLFALGPRPSQERWQPEQTGPSTGGRKKTTHRHRRTAPPDRATGIEQRSHRHCHPGLCCHPPVRRPSWSRPQSQNFSPALLAGES